MKIEGLYTALVTPFDAQGHVNEKSLVTLLHYQMMAGVDGIALCGSTGEGNILEDAERDFIIKIAVRELKGKIPLMVCCGSPSTKRVVELVKKAEALGADSILAVTPFYTKPTQEGIFLHFQEIVQATPLPICVYNIASRTGQNIETHTLHRLAAFPTIVSVKEASGSVSQVQDVIEKIAHKRPDFSVLSGDDMLALPLITLGAHGLVSVISNLLPKTTKRLIDQARKSNIAEARALHYAMHPICAGCYVESNPIPLKRMLHYAGFDVGAFRLPLCMPTKANEEHILKAYQSCSHLIEEELAHAISLNIPDTFRL